MPALRKFKHPPAADPVKVALAREAVRRLQERNERRSRRMLKSVLKLARRERLIYVLAADKSHRHDLRNLLLTICPKAKEESEHTVRLPWGNMINIAWANPLGQIDWHNVRLMEDDYPLFVDPFTIETRFPRLLEELHRWDGP